MKSRKEDLKRAQDLSAAGEHEAAYAIADRYLKEDPNDPAFITIFCYIMLQTGKATMGYTLAKRATQLLPKDAGAWLNMGMAANDLWQSKEAERAYKKALKFAPEDHRKSMICVNIGSLYVDTGRFAEGEKYCRMALDYNPESIKGKANLGFCQLAQRQWVPGWENYRYCIGSEWRPKVRYNDEPMWDGESRGTIVVSGEQGLGDEISFASMVPDMEAWARKNKSTIILECEPRLEGLFRRTFPNIEVYGTRVAKKVTWDVTRVDYAIPAAQLGEYFRKKDSDFPGTPFLKPDPDRVLQWKALFASKKKPVFGLAWRSGIPKTGSRFRQLDLEQLLPLLRSVDAHWVSLQYKPAQKEIDAFREKYPDIDIAEYKHGTLTNDYDDTVAMMAALDHCVIMHTAAGHVAGGLGIPCWTFVPRNNQWRYGTDDKEDFPWAKSVRIIHQKENGEWADIIEKTAGELSALYAGIPAAAADNARENPPLRKSGRKVRGNGRGNHRPTGADKPA